MSRLYAFMAAGGAAAALLASACTQEESPTEPANSGTQNATPTPTAVSAGLTLIALTANGAETCGVEATGAAHCWGNNRYGQLGTTTNNDTDTPTYSPQAVTGGLSFLSQ